jgi:formyl-CoA transferase
MGRPALAADPRYATHLARGERQAELDALIEVWTREHTVAQVEAAMIEAAVPAGKIYRAADMLADPHFAAREALVELDHPRWGKLPMQNAFPKLSLTPGAVRRPASQTVGQDNAEVFAELGVGAAELEALRAAGVV